MSGMTAEIAAGYAGIRLFVERAALIDWSFALLDEAERVVFRRLGVFTGSFDLAGAEAVVPGGLIEPEAVMDLVVSLLDKSLIIRLPSTEREPRYRLLESTRDYALEKLAEAGETGMLQRAHAQHMVAVFGAARRRWADTDAVVWERNIEPEVENLRASLAWAFGDDGIGITLAARLRAVVGSNLLDRRTQFALVREAAKKLTPETPGEDAAGLWYALATDTSTSARARVEAAVRARGLFEALGDRQMVGVALALAALTLALAGDAGGVQHYADATRAILPTIPVNLNKATILFNLDGVERPLFLAFNSGGLR